YICLRSEKNGRLCVVMSSSQTEKITLDTQNEKEADKSNEPCEDSSSVPLTSSEQQVAQNEPPDGGLLAWSQVLAGHLATMSSTGYTNAFGFFLSYYTTALDESPSTISWVVSIQGFLIYFIAAFSGRAMDAGYYYHFAITGLILQLLGIFMTSLVSSYWQLMLAQGICQGLGSGLVITPTMAVVATYFSKKRALAMCGVSSGSATGGVIFPLIARQLLGRVGMGWTVRTFGFVCLANAAITLAIIKPRKLPRKSGAVIALGSLRDAWFGVFALAMFMLMLGFYFVYYYVTSFAQNVLSAPTGTSLTLLLVINALGVPGRIIPSCLSDWYTGPQNMLMILVALTGILGFVWAGIHSLSGLWGLVVLYGFIGANIQSLTAPALASAGRDPAKIGAEMGMIFTVMSIGQLAGPPIAGALISSGGGDYFYAQMFAGSVIIGGALLFIASRALSAGWKWKKC
ncbi:Aspyridones efflux protein apdF, partial [Lachnellula suecica]